MKIASSIDAESIFSFFCSFRVIRDCLMQLAIVIAMAGAISSEDTRNA